MPTHLHRAASPHAPELTRRGRRLKAEAEARFEEQAAREHVSILRGLIWLGLLILVLSVAHAGLHEAFVPAWWREW